ncbi:putative acylesterase/phospholipase RssA [Bradyrhizobium japonicum]|uniref:patatin-like phospholipase family protein n=1 Tax=Bradyrhizobium japonicum TaxID=375 RepID=UPI00339B1066
MEERKLAPPKSIRLCLSGGGLRATFFHLGVIRALRQLDLLPKVTDVVSVSGGSIITAHLIQHWGKYISDDPEIFDQAQSSLLSLRTLDLRGAVIRRSVLWWPLYFLSLRFPRLLSSLRKGRTEFLRQQYDRYFGKITLSQLGSSSPGSPQFHLVCANLVSGNLCSFTKRDYVVVERKEDAATGMVQKQLQSYAAELTEISLAVAASSAFPPVFPPILFDEGMTSAKPGDFHPSPHVLTDGGVYDNTGFESAALLEAEKLANGGSASDFIIVSDAGSPFQWQLNSEFRDPFSLALRASEIVANRVAEETLRRIVAQEKIALISIDKIEPNEETATVDPLSPTVERFISEIRTDLDRFSDCEAGALVALGEKKAVAQFRNKLQIISSKATNGFPLELPSPPELVHALTKSWQVKWWNSFTNFSDWRTYVILAIPILIVSVPGLTATYLLKTWVQYKAAQAAEAAQRDFQNTTQALRTRNRALVEQNEAISSEASELRKQLSNLQPQYKACRSPAHGPPESFAIDKVITQQSGWRPGGYNPSAWCGDVQTQLRAQFKEPILEVKGMNEERRDACQPFRCIQYQYTCIVRVLADPVYPEKVSPSCPPADH